MTDEVKVISLDPTVAQIIFEGGMLAACAVASSKGFITDEQARSIYKMGGDESLALFAETIPMMAKEHDCEVKVATVSTEGGITLLEVLDLMRGVIEDENDRDKIRARFPESVADICEHRMQQGLKLFRSAYADSDVTACIQAVESTAKDLHSIINGAKAEQ